MLSLSEIQARMCAGDLKFKMGCLALARCSWLYACYLLLGKKQAVGACVCVSCQPGGRSVVHAWAEAQISIDRWLDGHFFEIES
jgi:hypothetical protein